MDDGMKRGRIYRPKKSKRGAALLEILFATSFFTIATLALLASTVGIFKLQNNQDEATKMVAGAHSIVEQILASDFGDAAFQNGTVIPGTKVPATANIPDLVYKLTVVDIDACTKKYEIACFIGDDATSKYTTNIMKTCPSLLQSSLFAVGGAENNAVYESLYKNGAGIPSAIYPLIDASAGGTGAGAGAGAGATNGTGSGSTSGGGCFLGGTMITMANGGMKPIEQIVLGDQVLSLDMKTGKTVASDVTETFIHPENQGGYYVINGIKITGNHPLWINGKFQDAGNARIGDRLRDLDGSETEIVSIEYLPGTFTVYNFEVKDTHNYFTKNMLGHNISGGKATGEGEAGGDGEGASEASGGPEH